MSLYDIEPLICIYCALVISPDEDSQKVNKTDWAHTTCAWAVNDAFFAAWDMLIDNE